MTKLFPATILAAVLAVSGCQMTQTERNIAGGAAGAATGLAAATLLGGGTNWRILGAVAGAAAGTMLVQDPRTGTCYHRRSDGTGYEAPCR